MKRPVGRGFESLPAHSDKLRSQIIMIDVILEKDNKILVIERNSEPFKGMLALPGGHVEYGETVEEAAIRETQEETGLKVKLKEILGVYSDLSRDPRGHAITTAFIAEFVSGELKSGGDASEAFWIDIKDIKLKEFGFDHRKIVNDYLKWRNKPRTFWSSKEV